MIKYERVVTGVYASIGTDNSLWVTVYTDTTKKNEKNMSHFQFSKDDDNANIQGEHVFFKKIK